MMGAGTRKVGRNLYQQQALAAVLASTFKGHDTVTRILALSDAMAVLANDAGLDVESAASIVANFAKRRSNDMAIERRFPR